MNSGEDRSLSHFTLPLMSKAAANHRTGTMKMCRKCCLIGAFTQYVFAIALHFHGYSKSHALGSRHFHGVRYTLFRWALFSTCMQDTLHCNAAIRFMFYFWLTKNATCVSTLRYWHTMAVFADQVSRLLF